MIAASARLVLVSALVFACCSANAARTIAFWPFGEYGLNDASGNTNTLVQTGVAIGETAVMDGSQLVFQTANALDLSSCDAVTVEFWIKVDPTGLGSSMSFLELSKSTNEDLGGFMLDIHENPERSDNAVMGIWRTAGGYSAADEPLGIPHILAEGACTERAFCESFFK